MSEMFRTPSCVANVWMLYLRSPSTSGRSCKGSRELAQDLAGMERSHLCDSNHRGKQSHEAGDKYDGGAPLLAEVRRCQQSVNKLG